MKGKSKAHAVVVEKCPDTGLYVGHLPGIPGAHSQGAMLNELSENLEQVTAMLKRILIIPDIHLKHLQAERIVEREKADLTIFAGDYFDDFGDSPRANQATAHWLQQSLEKPNRIHLLGNHDAHYRWPHMACSGFTQAKCTAIRKVLGEEGFERLELYYYDQASNTLFTHAGLTRPLVECRGGWQLALEEDEEPKPTRTRSPYYATENNWLYAPGAARGGHVRYGGPLWCDTREFEPIPGLNQIFGHTPWEAPRWKDKAGWEDTAMESEAPFDLCLDTHLRHYALLEGTRVVVRRMEEA